MTHHDELFRWIIRSTTDGLWIFDDAGITTYANERLAEILGRTPAEMLGMPADDVLDPEGREQFAEHLRDLASTDVGQDNLECSLLRKDGSRIWSLVSHSPLLDDAGVRRGWLHRVTELTERKLLLEKVLHSEQQLAEAQALARVGSWDWDVRRDVVTWSDELYRIYDIDPEGFEATYEGFLAQIHPDDQSAVRESVGTVFAAQDTFEFDGRFLKKDGSEGWVRGRGRATRDAAGELLRLSGTAQEITESVRAERELAEARDAAVRASRMKSDFLATMSHEIRTPLSGVIGLTDLLLASDLTASQQRLADGISRAGRTLLGLVNDILDLSKIEAGRLELEVVDFDVRHVVESVVDLVATAARAKGLDLVVSCNADVPRTLRGDPVRFGQILTNLVSNAVKFTEAGQVLVHVRVDARVDARAAAASGERCLLRVEVTDTGIGIPEETQELLFESFTQADASITREYGGTGLGLAIARRLAEAFDGEIGVTSTEGVGSTFWFTASLLPSAAAAPTGRGLVSPRLASPSGDRPGGVPPGRGRVLVAEDNVVNQMVARGALEGLGYEVEFAQDGIAAVAALAAAPQGYLAVLMDCHMPRLDGYAATRAIREHEPAGTRVPIIAMTASAVLGERGRCLEAGMDDFLVKPVDFALLAATLERWTARAAPVEAPVAAAAVIDLARVAMLRDLQIDDGSLFEQFVDSFVDRVPEELACVTSAVRDGDHHGLVEAAHRLRGSAQNLGAAQVGLTCQVLEDAGERGDSEAAHAWLPRLAPEIEAACAALRELTVSPHRPGPDRASDPRPS